MSAIECEERYGHLTKEQIVAARDLLESNDVPEPYNFFVSMEEERKAYYDQWQRVVDKLTVQPNSRLKSVMTMEEYGRGRMLKAVRTHSKDAKVIIHVTG